MIMIGEEHQWFAFFVLLFLIVKKYSTYSFTEHKVLPLDSITSNVYFDLKLDILHQAYMFTPKITEYNISNSKHFNI